MMGTKRDRRVSPGVYFLLAALLFVLFFIVTESGAQGVWVALGAGLTGLSAFVSALYGILRYMSEKQPWHPPE